MSSEPSPFDRANESAEDPVISREAIVSAVMAFLAAQDSQTLEDVRLCLDRELDDAGAAALVALGRRLGNTGDEWTYYPAEPLARRIHLAVADRVLLPGSGLFGVERLQAIAGEPVAIFCNHLSYSDANLLQVLLKRAGASDLADRLTAVAGPKVYSSLRRRFSSLCFGTIRVPQSSSLSSENAVMSVREVAVGARRSIESAHARLGMGDALVLFAEGTRSPEQRAPAIAARCRAIPLARRSVGAPDRDDWRRSALSSRRGTTESREGSRAGRPAGPRRRSSRSSGWRSADHDGCHRRGDSQPSAGKISRSLRRWPRGTGWRAIGLACRLRRRRLTLSERYLPDARARDSS